MNIKNLFPLSVKVRYRTVGKYLRFIVRKIIHTRVKKTILGKGNSIYYDHSAILDDVAIIINGNNNIIKINGECHLRGVIFDIKGNDNQIEIGENCLFDKIKQIGYGQNEYGMVFNIRGINHKINIGEKCQFRRGGTLWFADSEGSLSIGNNSTFEEVVIAINEIESEVSIGSDCMLAYDIEIRVGDSHSILDSETGTRINYAQNIKIGDHVWIAPHCVILKGVEIADHSIVGTGTIVSSSFEEGNVIIAGNPGKIIKKNINWNRERL